MQKQIATQRLVLRPVQSMNLLDGLNPQHYGIQLLLLLVGCAVLAFGINLDVAPKVLMVPGEGVVQAVSTVLHKDFGTVKVCLDVTLMITAVALSFLFFHGLNGIREGTIFSAILVGLIVKVYHRFLPAINRIAA